MHRLRGENGMSTQPDADIEMGNEEQEYVPLEEKYKAQMRQIYPQKIELPISTLPEMIKEQIKLNPEFQRRDIWKTQKRSRFIESIIMNVPIPPVFLGEDDYGKYVVLDGRQRLTAVHEFLLNSYRLEGLKVWDELNKLSFQDLKKKGIDKAILRRFIPAVIILKESSAEVKYDVFDRLNTGGVVAEPMEIRNAICRGDFNRLLHTLSDNKTFRSLWDIPLDNDKRLDSKAYTRMDDLELVLRFFALQDYETFTGTFRDFLSSFMSKRNSEYTSDAKLMTQDKSLFERAVTNCHKALGPDAFRKPSASGEKKSVKSAPLADALMYALASIATDQINDDATKRIRSSIRSLFNSDADFRKSIGTGTNGKGATRYRLEKASEVIARALKEKNRA
jgi:Protein of unknown function DUF262